MDEKRNGPGLHLVGGTASSAEEEAEELAAYTWRDRRRRVNDEQALQGIQGRKLTESERQAIDRAFEESVPEARPRPNWALRIGFWVSIWQSAVILFLVWKLIEASQALKAAGL